MRDQYKNAFLSGLKSTDFATLEPHLIHVDLAAGHTLHSQGEEIEYVYFPTGSVLSLITRGLSGDIEASLIGAEGVCGVIEACGRSAWGVDIVVQVGGDAFRCPAKTLSALTISSQAFAEAAWRAAALQIAECRQSAYCQANHKVDQRLARWILESVQRSGGRNPLSMTQEFLADMLGVQRTTVTMSASNLQRKGLIRYRRGQITVADFPRLESEACDCRTAMTEERKRLSFEAPASPSLPLGDRTMDPS